MALAIQTLMRTGDGSLVDFRKYDGEIRDPFYIEGAVVLDCDGTKVLDETMWDLVDQLWAYLIDGAARLRSGLDFSTYFPDQPLELAIRHLGKSGKVLVATNVDGANDAVVERDALVSEIASRGGEFLEWLKAALGPSSDTFVYRELQQRALDLRRIR